MVRKPAVAGQFYPGTKEGLERDLAKMIPDIAEKIDAIGAMSPHAGYIYSGPVAGEVYARLKPKGTYIILNPNHTGYGAQFALSAEPWATPLGEAEIDEKLVGILKKKTSLIEEDPSGHLFEHSAEVQVPFIQRISPNAKIVPITCSYGDITELEDVAGAIAGAIEETGRNATIIASSDMTHYEPRKSAEKKDKKAIDRILELDPEGLLQTVSRENISMCGYLPTAVMLMAAKKLGAQKAELVKYADSGDSTGDTFQVVGYAGVIVY
jgi:AmmeMemoRadiSam system protein B